MSGKNCQQIVCIISASQFQEQNRQLSRKGGIQLDSYMWTLDKATAS